MSCMLKCLSGEGRERENRASQVSTARRRSGASLEIPDAMDSNRLGDVVRGCRDGVGCW